MQREAWAAAIDACRPEYAEGKSPRIGRLLATAYLRSGDPDRLSGTAVSPRLRGQPAMTVLKASVDGEDVLAAVGRLSHANWGVAVTFPAALVERQVLESL